ncbi:MAG: trigger factor [Clostridia bacterium]|nr:trigger factor [Clostridia bacterium]
MTLKSVTSPETNVSVLEITIDSETFAAAVTAAYNKKKGSITVPGFRKGKAPRAIVEKMYGTGFFYDDALSAVVPAAYEEALKESGLNVVSAPEYEVVSIDENGVLFNARVYTKPEVSIEGYKGIEVKRTVAPVSDDAVNTEIARIQERNARTEEITDRAAALGDTVNIDYEGFKDGVAFAGGKADGHNLELGSGSFIPGFEDQIVGHTVGESFDINLSFPADYHAEELAGAAVTFKINLNGISTKILPELDDDFAKDVSEFDTLDEYKADVRAKLEADAAKRADNEVENQIIEALTEKLVAEIPEPMIAAETENFVRDYDNRLRMQGLKLDDYLKYTGMSLDDIRAQMRPRAESQVKVRLALEKIAALENITASDEDVEAELTKLSEAYNMELDRVKALVDPADVKADVCIQKAVELVKANAVITEAAPEAAAE